MKPYHQMSMRQRINHIPLPDLIVDVVDHTLALDWRQLFSRFFTEEKKKFIVGTDGAHISLRQGCRDDGTPECCTISNSYILE